MALLWPEILYPASVSFHPLPMSAFGPASTGGNRQAVGTDAGFWRATLSDVRIWSEDEVREWRWLIAAAQGGLEDILVGPFDCRQAPRPFRHRGVSVTGIPHSDGSLFSDGSGYSQSLVKMVLAADAALRATTLTVEIEIAGPLRRGMYFSIADRMYIVTSAPVILVEGGTYGAGQQASFSFLPPLRAAASAGDAVEFGKPRATMRLASGQTGMLDLRGGRTGNPSVELIEAFSGF